MDTYLRLHKQRHTKVNSVSAHDIINILGGLATSESQVEDSADVVLLEDFAKCALILLGELNYVHLDLVFGCRLQMLFNIITSSVKFVTQR
ncbi:hypothetical protein RRF57_003812 [Xylaria bambusicola]|uniref:Uncharacterized protein n=1 Tax=Xylaria bambusicola TaxID=326684 RepID=A0AAN7Z370_9PEZI